jgi:hypothetical protein
MPQGQFVEVKLLRGDAGLQVTGVYDPKIASPQHMVGSAFIGFLIIQSDDQNNPTRIIDDVCGWTYAAPDQATGKYHEWSKIVDPDKVRASGIQVGRARAIGTAVQITVYDPDDPHVPPGVEYFTWCVDQAIVDGS